MKSPMLSIIIPAYNEEKRLPSTMEKLVEFTNLYTIPIEVIIVVEPSPDKTLEVAKEWEDKLKYVKVIENEKRLGKGGTVRKGVLQSTGKYVSFMDADGATHLSFLAESYNILEKKEYDIVIASRSLKDSQLIHKQPPFRQFIGFIFRKITQTFLGLPYNDTQCGCKIFDRHTVNKLFDEVIEEGFAFDVELLIKAKKYQYTVLEKPCIWEDMEGSTVNPFVDGMNMLKAIVRIKKHYRV